MAAARWARVERHTTRVAQAAPVSAAGARRLPSPLVNAATSPKVQEQQGSSQPATEQAGGRTATLSLVRPSGSVSRTRPQMPHGRHTLTMAVEVFRYRPAPDHHDEWLQRIKELVTATGDSATLSCWLRPQPFLANDEEQDAPAPPPRHESRSRIGSATP
ncbi:hypothetical protein D1007_24177 [Hordeum vulgare]|nr:hypothetical protein D1007_24177 [Hordeum vulgare]